MPFTDPDTIIIRENRQRQTLVDREGIKSSIARLGQIHPIILRKEEDVLVLVAGEQRLLSFRDLKADGVKIPRTKANQIEYRLWSDLTPREAELIELEENAKRSDVPWRENVSAIGRIHAIYSEDDLAWTIQKTAAAVSLTEWHVNATLKVFKNLNDPALRDCTSARQAYSVLQTMAERRAVAIVADIAKIGASLFKPDEGKSSDPPSSPSPSVVDLSNGGDSDSSGGHATPSPTSQEAVPTDTQRTEPAAPPPPSILNISFLDWIKTYTGDKFNLLHVDFPYDVEYRSYAKSTTSMGAEYEATGFDDLLNALCENTDKIASYSCHMIFWFSMRFYEDIRKRLTDADWFVHYRPLVWAKSDNAGIIPGTQNQYPRWTYETAFLCSRGKRPLVKQLADHYHAPNSSNPIHPSQKPEPVLRHFLAMVVDETTDVLDPTCGSATALRAAESLGARSILGLEIHKDYADAAEAETQKARRARRASALI